MTDGFVVIDLNGNILKSNKAYQEMTGYTDEELSRINFYEITPAQWHEYERNVIQNQILRLGYSDVYEKEYIKKDGTTIPIELHGFVVKNKSGQPETMWGLVRDVSKRKFIEAELRKSERKFSTIFNTAPLLIAISEIETGKYIEINNHFLKTLGFTRNEVIGNTSLGIGIFSISVREELLKKIKSAGYIYGEEIIFRTKDGRTITCLYNIDLMEIEGNKYLLSSGIDITERKQIELALKQSEDKFSTIFKNAPMFIGISEFDTGHILDVNEYLLEKLGYSKEELIGQTVVEKGILVKTDREKIIQKLRNGEPVVGTEVHYKAKDGKIITCLFNINFIEINGVRRVLSTGVDITERKQIELALRQSEEKFSKIYNNAPMLISISELETGKYLDVNEYFVTVSGFRKEEILGRTLIELGLGKQSERESIKAILRSGGSVSKREINFKSKDGRNVTCLYSVDVIEIDGIKRLLTTGIDITDRKNVESALKESELKFRQIFETLGTGIIYFDDKGYIYDVNPALLTMVGVKKEFLIGNNLLTLVKQVYHENNKHDFVRAIVSILKGASVSGFKIDFGEKHMEASTFRDTNSTMITCVLTDLTERKKLEDDKLVILQRQKDLIAAIPDILMEVNIQKVYVWTNQSGYDFFGNDVLGKEASYYFDGEQDTYEKVEPLFMSEKESIYVESWQRRKDGKKRLLAWWSKVLKDSHGNIIGVISSARDITERNEREDDLRNSHEQLKRLHLYVQTVRENERAHLAREIHDELGQMLTALKIELKSTISEKGLTKPIANHLGESVKLVDSIISSVQTISSELHPQILDDLGLTTAIEWYIRGFESRTRIHCTKSIDFIELDKSSSIHLFRIVQESLTNIARHSKATKVKIVLKRFSGRYVLTINDNGIGMTAEQLKNGHSLGMLSMRERALIMNGVFVLSSIPKKGTTVKVTIKIDKKEHA